MISNQLPLKMILLLLIMLILLLIIIIIIIIILIREDIDVDNNKLYHILKLSNRTIMTNIFKQRQNIALE